MQITTIGLDIAKNVFYAVGLNRAGQKVWGKRLRRGKVLETFANLPAGTVGIEACAGSHYWGRELERLGHRVRLIPPQHVKPLARRQKNDAHDALAIAEALSRPQIRFVPIKSVADHDRQAVHRVRKRQQGWRTALVNQTRGLLGEYGIVIPQGIGHLRQAIPRLLEDADNGLTDDFRALLASHYELLGMLDRRIDALDTQIAREVKGDETAQRLLTIPGFGPIVTSAWRARISDPQAFRRGRDVAASLGLVPRQHSSGGKTQLLGITKAGDAYLRTQLIHGARAVLNHAHRKDDPLSRWVTRVAQRRGRNVATVALANKLARIAWAVTTTHTPYDPRRAT